MHLSGIERYTFSPISSTSPQTATHTSFIVSGVRGQVLSTVLAPTETSISPPTHGARAIAPELSPPQRKSSIGDQEFPVLSPLTAQVKVHVPVH